MLYWMKPYNIAWKPILHAASSGVVANVTNIIGLNQETNRWHKGKWNFVSGSMKPHASLSNSERKHWIRNHPFAEQRQYSDTDMLRCTMYMYIKVTLRQYIITHLCPNLIPIPFMQIFTSWNTYILLFVRVLANDPYWISESGISCTDIHVMCSWRVWPDL